MRLRSCLAIVAVLQLLLPAMADEAALRAAEKLPPLPIGTIDMVHIFKSFEPVKEKLAPLRADVQELEQKIQLRQVELEQIQRKLAAMPRPGEDREKLQQQFVKLQRELQDYVQRERVSVQTRETAIQVEVYKAVQIEVRKIAEQRKLKMVIVRPRLSLDSNDLQEVARALNQHIIFEDGLDITDDVLTAMEASHKTKPITNEENK